MGNCQIAPPGLPNILPALGRADQGNREIPSQMDLRYNVKMGNPEYRGIWCQRQMICRFKKHMSGASGGTGEAGMDGPYAGFRLTGILNSMGFQI